MTFAEKVQEVRGLLRLTQMQLATELEVAFTTINRWEKGRNEPQFLERRKFDDFCKKHGIIFNDKGEV